MLKLQVIFLGILVWSIKTSAQTNYFARTYDIQGSDKAKAIVAHPDSGYVVLGNTNIKNHFDANFYIMRIDEQGEVMWDRTWGGSPDREECRYFVSTSDFGYMVTGRIATAPEEGSYDAYIARLDAEGFLLWERRIDVKNSDQPSSICHAGNGEYIIVGASRLGWVESDVLFIRIDENGSISQQKTIDTGGFDRGHWIRPGPGGEFFIAGMTGAGDILYMKTDRDGNVLWQQIIGEPTTYECAIEVFETGDNGFIVVGEWTKTDIAIDIYVSKIDSSNNIEWFRTYGEPDVLESMGIKTTRDGGYIIFGQKLYRGVPYGNSDFNLMKLDRDGEVEWSRTWGGPDHDTLLEGLQTRDGGYIFVGHFGYHPPYETDTCSDIYVIKTDEKGLVTSVHTPTANRRAEQFILFPNYPNPFNAVTTIQFYLPKASNIRVSVINVYGRVVEVLKQGYAQAGLQNLQWDATGRASSVYYLVLESGGRKQVRAMSLVR